MKGQFGWANSPTKLVVLKTRSGGLMWFVACGKLEIYDHNLSGILIKKIKIGEAVVNGGNHAPISLSI